MNIRYILPAMVAAVLGTAAISCTDDNSSYGGGALPALSVVVPENDDMPVYNFNYGDNCVLTPDVRYDGTGELQYEWSVGTYIDGLKGPLEVVSNEKTLTYFFPQGGSYYAHLTVTDGTVGIVQDYAISINRTFEQGYLIVSNNNAGEGNLAFIKDLTREEIEEGLPQTLMENCLQRVNSNIGKSKLCGSMIIQWYAWTGNTVSPVNRLVIVTENEGLYIDPNTFVLSSEINYEEVMPGFKGDDFMLRNTNPLVMDMKQRRYLSLNSDYMFGYEDSEWKDHFFDYVCKNTLMVGENQTHYNFFINRSPLAVEEKTYYGWTSTQELKDADGNTLFNNEELVCAFLGDGIPNSSGTTYPGCIISRNKSNGNYFATTLTGFGGYSFNLDIHSRGKIAVDASTAIPDTEARIVTSQTYHRTYYPCDNNIYVMLADGGTMQLPSKEKAAINIPAGEELTFMDIHTITNGEELLVATADKSTGRGNVYIYDVRDVRTDNPNPSPKARYKNCADRITSIMYKPRIAN